VSRDLPGYSFGFTPVPPPDPGQPPRVLREVQILYLSLDLYPGPYGGIPQATDRDQVKAEHSGLAAAEPGPGQPVPGDEDGA
jgi:hypothetical protein